MLVVCLLRGDSMEKAELAKQLELYSNAIVGFIVLQGLAFCYAFGTQPKFNDILRSYVSLSAGLTLLFLVVLVLALVANNFLRRQLELLSADHAALVKSVYLGKAIVIVIFGLLPVIITVCFAMLGSLPP